MSREELKDLSGLLTLKKLLDDRLKRLEKEIAEVEEKVLSVTDPSLHNELLEVFRKREADTLELKLEIENKASEIEEALKSEWKKLTPWEAIIIQKIYIDGLRWDEFEALMYSDEKYRNMRKEKSSYMRYHRSALDKLGVPTVKRGGRPRVQKTEGD